MRTNTTGQDVIGIAATGSGKTLAFGLPALAHTRAQLAAGVADGEQPQREALSVAAVDAPSACTAKCEQLTLFVRRVSQHQTPLTAPDAQSQPCHTHSVRQKPSGPDLDTLY
jgi:DEAD/DEAH box helicase